MGIINMKEDKLSKMEIVHIALITAFVLTEIIMSGIMIILMRRTKKIYLEIRNIEKMCIRDSIYTGSGSYISFICRIYGQSVIFLPGNAD